MTGAWQRGLYVITDPELIPAAQLAEQVDAALAGGAVLVQYRDKQAAPAARRERAQAILRRCRARGVPLLINDDPDLAAALGADGVHLGREDADPVAARKRLGPRAVIGVSCYNQLARAEAAVAAGADYVAFGRFFASRTKPDAAQADIALLRRARLRLPVPVAAIGGIEAGNGAGLIAAGADLLAVVHGVFGKSDVTAAATSLAALFGAGHRMTDAASGSGR